MAPFGGFSRPIGRALLWWLALLGTCCLFACSAPLTAPADFEAGAYQPISYEDLLTPTRLTPNQKVVAPAYFWQELAYDPLMLRQYAHRAGQPRAWRQVRFYAVYGSPQMRGYFNRVVMTPEQARAAEVKRLDHLRLFGEVGALGGEGLYLRVHRLEKIEEE
ncbi:MAG: hypothetical protein FJ128_11735 [Deltaproteobacteria bacterium]|nr:hypothetical protein [Deltaproteobacteria bacterium]